MFSQLFRLSRHSIIYGLGSLAGSGAAFLLIPVYTHYLSPTGYGDLRLLQTSGFFLMVFSVMGLTTAAFRSYYLYDDEENRAAVMSSAFLFVTGASAVLALVLVAASGSLSSLVFGSKAYTVHFRLLCATVFCDAGIMVCLAILRAREQPTRYVLITLTKLLATLGLSILLVVVWDRGVLGVLEAGLMSSGCVYLTVVPTIFRRVRMAFSWPEIKRMLSFGLPMVPSGLAMWVLNLSDMYFLQFLSTTEQVGLYALGYNFGLVIGVGLVEPFQLAWAPFAFSVFREPNARDIYARVFTYYFAFLIAAVLVVSVLGRDIISAVAAPSFYNAYKVIPLIALSYAFHGCHYVLGVGISLMAKTHYLMLVAVGASVLNLGLNALLIPGHGQMGAAIATLVSFMLVAVGSLFLSQRFYRVDHEWDRAIKVVFAAALTYAGSLLIDTDPTLLNGALRLLSLLGYPILLYGLKFFRAEEVVKGWEIIRALTAYVKFRLT